MIILQYSFEEIFMDHLYSGLCVAREHLLYSEYLSPGRASPLLFGRSSRKSEIEVVSSSENSS